VSAPGGAPAIDLGKCLFCGACEKACDGKGITFTGNHRLAARERADLIATTPQSSVPSCRLDPQRLSLFKRSFRIRQVSAGGCNACEADTNVLGTLVFDLSRFGIQVVASPRHADGILITGPVTRNMELALKKTYEAIPPPKVVIAVGACAISGGMFADHTQVHKGAGDLLPVDLYIPGCPPHPYTILDGLLRLLGRID
jgi:Ni,Fe-hydrogenase III small subunit